MKKEETDSVLSDQESDDWNVISEDWKDYEKSNADITTTTTATTDEHDKTDLAPQKDSTVKSSATSNNKDKENIDLDATSNPIETKSETTVNDNIPNSDTNIYKQYISDLKTTLINTKITQSVLMRFICSLIFIYYAINLTKDTYYNYRINNMIGTIDDLPLDPKYVDLHFKKCNTMYSYYEDILLKCVESNTDNSQCLNSYYKLISKSAKFCDWNPDKIYALNSVNIVWKGNMDSFFKSIGNYVSKTSSKNAEYLKHLRSSWKPTFDNIYEKSIKAEKQIEEVVSQSIKENELDKKLDHFIDGSKDVLSYAGKHLKDGSTEAFEVSKKLASNVFDATNKLSIDTLEVSKKISSEAFDFSKKLSLDAFDVSKKLSSNAYEISKKLSADTIDFTGEYINRENLETARENVVSAFKGLYSKISGL